MSLVQLMIKNVKLVFSCYNFKQSPCTDDDQIVKLTVVITLNNVLVQMTTKM